MTILQNNVIKSGRLIQLFRYLEHKNKAMMINSKDTKEKSEEEEKQEILTTYKRI